VTEKWETCHSCRHWKGDEFEISQGGVKPTVDGECHRKPPKVFSFIDTRTGRPASRSFWPKTHSEEWCGEFESE
jgi:hypothetical protein